MSSDLHTKYRPLAAGFKAYYPTERTEHATIAWSDCAIQVCIIIIIIIVIIIIVCVRVFVCAGARACVRT